MPRGATVGQYEKLPNFGAAYSSRKKRRLGRNPVGPLPRFALRRLDLESQFFGDVPADKTANAVIRPVGGLGDLGQGRAFLALPEL